MWRSGGYAARLGFAAAVLLAVGGCGSDDSTSSAPDSSDGGRSGQLSVLSYNVAGLPQEVSDEQPTADIPLISPLLAEYDLVLTQEDFDWWTAALDGFDFAQYHDQLRADAGFEFATARHPGPEAVGIDPAERPLMQLGDGIGIMSVHPFTDEQRVPWEGCFGTINDGGASDCLAMKGFAVVTLQLADGVLLDVYSLHGEAGGTPDDQALQVEDFAQLAAFVEEHSEGRAVILGGDTNLHTDTVHPDSSDGADIGIWDDFLAATGLTDACTALDCPETGDIDKVAFRDGGGLRLTPTAHDFPAERFVDPDGEALSDHEPLVVEFDWEADG